MAIDYSGLSPATQAAFARLTAAGVANQAAADARNEQLARQRQEAQVALKAKYEAQRAAVIPFVAGNPGEADFDAAILKGLGPKWKNLAQNRLATRAAARAQYQSETPAERVARTTYRRFDWKTPGSALREKGWGEIGSLSAQTKGAAAARGLINIDPTNNISLDALREGIISKRAIDIGSYDPGKAQHFIDPESGYKLSPQQMLFLGGAGIPTPNSLFFQAELKGMGLTANSSDAQLAAGYDAVARGQQYKNQLPKRGADFGGIGGFVFNTVLPVAAGAINPLLGAAVGAGTGALSSRGELIPTVIGAARGYSGGQFVQNVAAHGLKNAILGLNPFQAPTTTVPSVPVGTALAQVAPPAVVAGNALTRGLGAIGRGAGAVGSYAAANPYLTATTLGAGYSAYTAPEPPTEKETTQLLLTAFPSLQQNQQGVGSLANMAAGTTPTPNVPYTYEPSYTGKVLGPSFMNQIERGLSTSGIRSLGPNFMSQVGLGTAAPSPSSGFASLDPNFMNQFERAKLGLA